MSLLTSDKIENLLQFVQSVQVHDTTQSNSNSTDKLLSIINDDESKEEKTNTTKTKQTPLKETFYLTTAIFYTNGKPHIGHAYEIVVSDIITRYHRIYGRDTFFLTGTDEHGQKVADTAARFNKTPRELCDENVLIFKKLNDALRSSNNHFIRTTDPDHYTLSQKMFLLAYENDDIYLDKYTGWYSVREEKYVTESQAAKTDYIDPVSNSPYTKQEEESYFFRMSKYQARLIEHYKNNVEAILPNKYYQQIMSRLQEPLQDLCVSRSTFSWGVPVPINPQHVLYVWFDALSNYLTGINYFDLNQTAPSKYNANPNLKRFWPCSVHIIGKDISWFHCVIWPCILMSCKIPLFKAVFCHGFVMDGQGQKMSKSIGNVVDPFEQLKKFDADSIRYFIAVQANFGDDMRWNQKDLKQRHDAHLTHIYGNLVNRTLVMLKKNCGSKIPDIRPYTDVFNLDELLAETEDAMSTFDLLKYTQIVMERLRVCNQWIVEKEPWNKKKYPAKSSTQKLEQQKVIRSMVEAVYILAHFMEPITPRASQQIFHDLNTERASICELSTSFENLKPGTKVTVGRLLFAQHSTKHERQQRNKNKPEIARVQFVVGRIVSVARHLTKQHLLVEEVDVGEPKLRQICSGLAPYYSEEELVNRHCVVFANLKSSKFSGTTSQGMLMCVGDGNKVVLIEPHEKCKVGERLHLQDCDFGQWAPDDSINIGKKNSFWKKDIVQKLKTDTDGRVCFDGVPFITSNGVVLTRVANGQIS